MLAVAKKKLNSEVFGPRLKELREERGWTQTELGEKAGMLHQNVAKYERGASQPTWPVVLRLAEALGVTPDAFLGD